MLFFWISKK